MRAPWPDGFERIPDEPWTQAPIEALARGYDSVENHGWYDNLEPTVDELLELLADGALAVDYSGGTGILFDRLLPRLGDRRCGLVNVDSSPKFLRLSLEKFRDEPRIAFRRLHFLKDEKRLELLEEALGPTLVARGLDALVSTNAIHLYYDLEDTLASWHRCLKPGARALVQSGNIGAPAPHDGRWLIDDTVHAIAREARAIVAEQDRYAAYRPVLEDEARMAAYGELTDRYFLPVRPLTFYTEALEEAGFRIERVVHRAVPARVMEWFEFLSVYHEGVLPWVGGAEKLDGAPADEGAVTHRHELMRRALERVFDGAETFEAEWTYVTALA